MRWTRLLGLLALMVVAYFVIPQPQQLQAGDLVRAILTLGLLVLLTLGLSRQLRRQFDQDRRIDGLVLTIVFVVLVFSFLFYLVSREPDQIAGLATRVDALYFTLSTLTTVGVGDVHAVSQRARILVILQMVFNGVFLAAAGGLLSSRVQAAARSRSRRRDQPGDEPSD